MIKCRAGFFKKGPLAEAFTEDLFRDKSEEIRDSFKVITFFLVFTSIFGQNSKQEAIGVESNISSKSLLSVCGMKGHVSSGGYSNLGT